MTSSYGDLSFFHEPRSIAVVGASEDPDKIGGRPIHFMKKSGYDGTIIPVNPRRSTVQDLPAVKRLRDADIVPEVAVIAVPGDLAVDSLREAAELGVRGCVVMSSGFAELGTAEGARRQETLEDIVRGSGMRVIGPNSQGIATFSSGAVLSFSTLFSEETALDGPVGIVSQSGAMAAVPYGILRRRGIGVRYCHGTGNDVDVSASELALTTVGDRELELLLLYLEKIEDAEVLVQLAEQSRRNEVPVIALVGGRTQSGSRAAASHTGALATERRTLDAFLDRIGIWQVHSQAELLAGVETYLQGWRPTGSRTAIVTNSGAFCVLGSDAADDAGLPLARFTDATVEQLREVLPPYASSVNPVDLTSALLTDSQLIGKVLPIVGADESVDAAILGVPVAGRGYDVPQFARDAAQAAATGLPVVVAAAQPSVAREFREQSLPVFEDESAAVAALTQFLGHQRLIERAQNLPRPAVTGAWGNEELVNEVDSLRFLESMGVPVVPVELVHQPDDAEEAFVRLGAEAVVVKGVTVAAAHKSEFGLVKLGVTSASEAVEAARQVRSSAESHGVPLDGLLLAPMVKAQVELMLGMHRDPVFGTVVVVGAGGKYVEAMPDSAVLVAPCTPQEVRDALSSLRLWPVMQGVRGEPRSDIDAFVDVVVQVSQETTKEGSRLAGFDANPVMLGPEGSGARVVDAAVFVVPDRTEHAGHDIQER